MNRPYRDYLNRAAEFRAAGFRGVRVMRYPGTGELAVRFTIPPGIGARPDAENIVAYEVPDSPITWRVVS